MARATVEQLRSIDINEFSRAGYVGDGASNWWGYRNRLARIGVQPVTWSDEVILLDQQNIRVTWQPWRFGGRRPYFRCTCGLRVGKLYAPPGYRWRCRECYELTYATRQATPRYRAILKARKIRERLGGGQNILDDFPSKPKGMHQRRYQRLRQTHDQAVENSLAMLASKRAWALATKLR